MTPLALLLAVSIDGIFLPIQSVNAKIERHGEGFKTSPAPDQSDRASIIMATQAIRPIRVEGNVAYVPLTQGYEAIIDAADVPLVGGFNWRADVKRNRQGDVLTVYAVREWRHSRGERGTTWMHRLIAKTPEGLVTDHADGDGLNNRRSNLRHATTTENNCNQRLAQTNTSGVKGVSWHPVKRKWKAYVNLHGKRFHIGYFASIADAEIAVESARLRIHGQFARIA